MARLGIDFGSTRTVVAVADRGNYPLVGFHYPDGTMLEWYPSLVAAGPEGVLYGLDAAEAAGRLDHAWLRSIKRRLAEASPESTIELGGRQHLLLELLVDYFRRLREDLEGRSNLELSPGEPLEAMIAVPANANANQRFLTLEGLSRAGFGVLGLLNEPSAAGLEYAHRFRGRSRLTQRELVAVYDLGGGTFDASVIRLSGGRLEVVTSEGIQRLGGDDFDEILAGLALEAAWQEQERLDGRSWHALLEECRVRKESLHHNHRRVTVDLAAALEGAGEVVLQVEDFYGRCRPLVERTLESLERAVAGAAATAERAIEAAEGSAGAAEGGAEDAWGRIAALYLVGGSTSLPLVSRLLRERHAPLIRRTPYPHSATAIGLAIFADERPGYTLQERFTRHFGVWRELEGGRRTVFEPIFPKDTPLPLPGGDPLAYTCAYAPAHNLGHYRYLECSRVGAGGNPEGDITPYGEIRFPFDPRLQGEADLQAVGVHRRQPLPGQQIRETYLCDPSGIIRVEIRNEPTGFRREFVVRR